MRTKDSSRGQASIATWFRASSSTSRVHVAVVLFAGTGCGRAELLLPCGDGLAGAGGGCVVEDTAGAEVGAGAEAGGGASCAGAEQGTNLYDGTTATGWRFIGRGQMVQQDGYVRTRGDGRGLGLWYYSARPFANFALNVEFRQQSLFANSGVYIRFPDPQGNVLRPIGEGYEVQIGGAPGEKDTTGAIYDIQAASPLGEIVEASNWNALQIRVVGQAYEVCLNGKIINSFVGERSAVGYIGIQVHDASTDVVDVRSVRIVELP